MKKWVVIFKRAPGDPVQHHTFGVVRPPVQTLEITVFADIKDLAITKATAQVTSQITNHIFLFDSIKELK